MKKLYTNYYPIWKCFNPSQYTHEMRNVIIQYLIKLQVNYFEDSSGNLIVGDFEKERPCLVAHMDSVHDEKIDNIAYYKKRSIITAKEGIGGDDKCGIVSILEILKYNNDVNAIFTIDEEIGGVGAEEMDENILSNVKYFIEIDRYGNDEVINQSGDNQIASDSFLNDLWPIMNKFGYVTGFGSFTDVNILTEKAQKSAINVACGYYNPHCLNEYVSLPDLNKCIQFVRNILIHLDNKYEWNYKQIISYNTTSYQDNTTSKYDDALSMDDVYFMIENINDMEDIYHLINVAYNCGKKDSLRYKESKKMKKKGKKKNLQYV